MKKVYLLLYAFIFGILTIAVTLIGCTGGGTGSGGGSSSPCPSGTCENLWVDGYYMCCQSDHRFGNRQTRRCYSTFSDAYTGFGSAGGGTLPASRICY